MCFSCFPLYKGRGSNARFILPTLLEKLQKEGIPLTRLLRLDGDDSTAKIYMRINVVDSQHIHKLLLLNDFVLL